MENSILDATTEIVAAAVSANDKYYPNEASAKELAKFTEIVYEKMYELEYKSR